MYEELDKPLRELALDEPLAERARGMMPPVAATAPNGIKLLRVVSVDKPNNEAVIELHFFNQNYLNAIKNSVTPPANIFAIYGGSRVRGGSAIGQVQVTNISKPIAADPVLMLTVKPIGDYSTYKLTIVASKVANPAPPNTETVLKIDPLFSEISFKFRPGCFNTNCAPEWETSIEPLPEPVIDYTAKDYNSFCQTMIAAMMQRVPEWQPTSEADLDMVLAELFSVAADELSDYQDRVMNEAYLATARKRVSLARHSRLMDYHIHQGNQAATWLALELGNDSGIKKSFQLKEGLKVWAGESTETAPKKETNNSIVYISRHLEAQTIHQYLNNIGLYTWSDTITTLKAGSTRADLKLYNRLYLDGSLPIDPINAELEVDKIRDLIRNGNIRYLLIKEHLNPETGLFAGRDPSKRQLLRLLSGKDGAETMFDAITNEWFLRVRWEKEDKLQRDYCFRVDCPIDNAGTAIGAVDNVSLFHGNLIEVFHGRQLTTVFKEPGELLSENVSDPLEFHYERTRWGTLCRLPEKFLAYKNTEPGGDVPPASTVKLNVKTSAAGTPDSWDEVPSLIHSDDSAEGGDHFVVETDENRASVVRFGNGTNGMELPDNAIVTCVYQYGEPLEGNVGSDMIVNFEMAAGLADPSLVIRKCWNPFDVTSGRDREPAAEIIRRVPEAYRQHQLRAVTLADYVARAEKIKGVSRAAARYAWTGSWRTVQVTIDPVATSELSYKLRKTVEASLSAVRLIGEDLEIRPPIFVPLEIKVKLCATPDVWPEDIKFVLEHEFSDGWTPDGRMGFFHPDLWTFGQPLYSSQIIGRALQVKGVEHAVPLGAISVMITRWNSPAAPVESFTQLNHNEIIMVQNDPDHMERGIITFDVKGGRQ